MTDLAVCSPVRVKAGSALGKALDIFHGTSGYVRKAPISTLPADIVLLGSILQMLDQGWVLLLPSGKVTDHHGNERVLKSLVFRLRGNVYA